MNLTDFSYEVLFNILLNSEPKDIANYCQTSKRASEICKSQDFWRAKLWKDYGKQRQTERMTWKQQYQSGQIKVINSPISSGGSYYGIIDDQGDLYAAGHFITLDQKFTRGPTKIDLGFKVTSVIAGSGYSWCNTFMGVVTVEGEVYFWKDEADEERGNSILSLSMKPDKLNFPISGKIVKIDRDNIFGIYGIIMDNGLAYLAEKIPAVKPIFIQPDTGKKIVDLILPGGLYDPIFIMCFFLDSSGNVYFFHPYENARTKLNFPDPIRQLSSSQDVNAALSIKGDVYVWSKKLFSRTSKINNYGLRGTTELPIFSFNTGSNLKDIVPSKIYKAEIPVPIKSISTGSGDVAAVTYNGTVYVWGSNDNNRLVDSAEEEKLLSSGKMFKFSSHEKGVILFPLELKLKSKIKSISLGNIFTIALTEDGVMNYWGNPNMTPKDTI